MNTRIYDCFNLIIFLVQLYILKYFFGLLKLFNIFKTFLDLLEKPFLRDVELKVIAIKLSGVDLM